MLHAAFVRSPYAARADHRRRRQRRARMPGVVAVLTGADLQQMTNQMPMHDAARCKRPVFCRSRPTRCASSATRSPGRGREPLPGRGRARPHRGRLRAAAAVATIEARARPERRAFDEVGDNVVFQDSHTYGDVDAAFAGADRVFKETFRQHRYANVPDGDARRASRTSTRSHGELTYYAATQSPHGCAVALAGLSTCRASAARRQQPTSAARSGSRASSTARTSRLPPPASSSGGRSSGSRTATSTSWPSAPGARGDARRRGRRRRTTARCSALKVDAWSMDQGAYPLVPFPSAIFAGAHARACSPARTSSPALSSTSTVVATNKAPYVAYRGPWEVGDAGCASACSTSSRASSASIRSRSGAATWSPPTSSPCR